MQGEYEAPLIGVVASGGGLEPHGRLPLGNVQVQDAVVGHIGFAAHHSARALHRILYLLEVYAVQRLALEHS